MKKIILITNFLFFAILIFCQSPKLEFVKKINNNVDLEAGYIAYKDKDGFIIANRQKGIKLLKYNNDFDLIWTEEIEIEKEKTTKSFFQFNDKIFWLSAEGSKTKIDYFINKLNPEGEEEIGNWKKLTSFAKTNKKDKPYVSSYLSQNKEHLLILIIDDLKDKKDKKFKFEYLILNRELEILKSNKLEFEESQYDLSLYGARISNSGEVKLFLSKKKKVNKKNIYEKRIIFIDSKTDKRKEVILVEPSKYFSTAKFLLLDESEELIVTGLFSNDPYRKKSNSKFSSSKGYNNPVNGYFFYQFDESGNQIQKIIHDFKNTDLLILGENNIQKNENNEIGLNQRFELDYFFYDYQREIFTLVLDDYERLTLIGHKNRTFYRYKNRDLVYFFLNKKGEIIEKGNIPRFQMSSYHNYPNGCLIKKIDGNGLYFTYNVGSENSKKPFSEKYSENFKKKVTISTLLEYNGKKTKYIHENNLKSHPYLVPYQSSKFDEKSYIIYGQRDKIADYSKKYIGRLTYE